MTAVTTAGGTATFTFEVVNTGSSLAQYRIFNNVDTPNPQSVSVATATTVVTTLADGPDGYYTTPIAAGKNEVLTVKVTTPKTANQYDAYLELLTVTDLAGNYLTASSTRTNIKSTTGDGAPDLYTTTTGSSAVVASSNEPGHGVAGVSFTSAEAIKPRAKSTFMVKLQNDLSAPLTFEVRFRSGADFPDCVSPFPATVKLGTVDLTSQMSSGSFYTTAALAHGKSLTFTVTVTAPAAALIPLGCDGAQSTLEAFSAPITDLSGDSISSMYTNVAA